MKMFSYKAMVHNIHHNGIRPNLKMLKEFIKECKIGGEEKTPAQRSFSFEEIGMILSAKSRYAI